MITNFFSPLFCYCFWIRDPGWVKIRIRDKYPGSATLLFTLLGDLDPVFFAVIRVRPLLLIRVMQNAETRPRAVMWSRNYLFRFLY
jgi:hypothetical protein